jgi:hypothetical protein
MKSKQNWKNKILENEDRQPNDCSLEGPSTVTEDTIFVTGRCMKTQAKLEK